AAAGSRGGVRGGAAAWFAPDIVASYIADAVVPEPGAARAQARPLTSDRRRSHDRATTYPRCGAPGATKVRCRCCSRGFAASRGHHAPRVRGLRNRPDARRNPARDQGLPTRRRLAPLPAVARNRRAPRRQPGHARADRPRTQALLRAEAL